jgi:hypothetical protein
MWRQWHGAHSLHSRLCGLGVISDGVKIVHDDTGAASACSRNDEVSVDTSFNSLSYRSTKSGAHEWGLKVYDRALSTQLHEIVDVAVTS